MNESITEEANRIVNGDRNDDYGDAYDNMNRTARIMSAMTELDVEARHVPMLMIAVKVAREMYKPKRDNRVDIAGWADILDQTVEAADRCDSLFGDLSKDDIEALRAVYREHVEGMENDEYSEDDEDGPVASINIYSTEGGVKAEVEAPYSIDRVALENSVDELVQAYSATLGEIAEGQGGLVEA